MKWNYYSENKFPWNIIFSYEPEVAQLFDPNAEMEPNDELIVVENVQEKITEPSLCEQDQISNDSGNQNSGTPWGTWVSILLVCSLSSRLVLKLEKWQNRIFALT